MLANLIVFHYHADSDRIAPEGVDVETERNASVVNTVRGLGNHSSGRTAVIIAWRDHERTPVMRGAGSGDLMERHPCRSLLTFVFDAVVALLT